MKLNKIVLFAGLFFVAASLSECTVNKRLYSRGYTVSWNSGMAAGNRNAENEKTEKLHPIVEYTKPKTEEPLYACADKTIRPEKKKLYVKPTAADKDTCGDLITMRNGEEIRAKVIEITPEVVEYRRCDNIDGPLIDAGVENIFMINYKNGSKEVFEKKGNKIRTNKTFDKQNTSLQSAENKKYNGYAVASLVCLLTPFLYVTVLLAPILGIIALHQFKKEPGKYKGKWMAKLSVTVFFVSLLLVVLASLLFLLLLSSAM